MKKSVSRSSRGGFTLIEIVVSTALLAVVCTGFLMMTAANAGQLSESRDWNSLIITSAPWLAKGRESLPEKPLQWSLAWKKGTESGKYLNSMKSLNRRRIQVYHMTFYRHR
ncbi:MAG: prepilin-type N-terminal cleavage/methylation domain-containing protein [Enterocloster bolteae]